MKTIAFFLTMLVPAVASAQETPTGGYAPVNGLKMYYEVHGSGEPVVLLHGAYMTIPGNWTGWIGELSKTRKVIAVELQGHGRTADIKRDLTFENLSDDVAALLDHLKIPSADLIGFSMGGGVAMECAIRHPEKVRKVVSISAVLRHDGWVKEAVDALPKLTAEVFKGSPIEAEYKKLSPTPNEFPEFVSTSSRWLRSHTTLAPTSSKPPRRRYSSSMAMPTACGSSTSRKCSASRVATFSATWARAQHRDWPSCPIRHMSPSWTA
jgi:pimeloyl-ACP methyl ester carboxylesterase